MTNNREATLAEKISKLIDSESRSSELASLFAAVERIERRLNRLENEGPAVSFPALSDTKHPSRDRFEIAEAVTDAVFDSQTKEKTCTFEPNGRPCDHCSMCRSRGF